MAAVQMRAAATEVPSARQWPRIAWSKNLAPPAGTGVSVC